MSGRSMAGAAVLAAVVLALSVGTAPSAGAEDDRGLLPVGMGPGVPSSPRTAASGTPPSTATADAVAITGFRTSGVSLVVVPPGSRPYDDEPALPPGGSGIVDDEGVRMFRLPNGDPRLWNHPVAQAQYALQNLNSYRLTHTAIYLDRALANAQRLIDTRTDVAGAWFFPYPFDWSFYGDTTCFAPWYSAMAQGQALSVFVRLHQVTGDDQWRTAADATFASLLQSPAAGSPFASWVDGSQNLWLEEYPQPDVVSSERVLNGHVFAAFGLHDYWVLTRDARAATLFDGAVTTVQQTDLTQFRQPGWASFYSLRHKQVNLAYHPLHVRQLLHLFQLTHRVRFAAAAVTYRADYPLTSVSGRATLTPRLRRLFRVRSGTVILSRKVVLDRRRTVSVDQRTQTHGGGVMLRISTGRHTGWYVRERYGRAWVAAPSDEHRYRPHPVHIVFQPGTYVGYRYSSTGRRTAIRTVRFTRRSSAPTARSAIVGGQPSYQLTSGTWAGYWVPVQSGMWLS